MDRDKAIRTLVQEVRNGRPVVPLVGAGISIEAGVPPLSEVTRYLAKTKAYLRYRIFQNRPPSHERGTRAGGEGRFQEDRLTGITKDPRPFGMQPRDFLRDFGWPEPHELNSSLWHWLWKDQRDQKPEAVLADRLNLLVNGEILESLGRIDSTLPASLQEAVDELRVAYEALKQADPEKAKKPEILVNPAKWMLKGSYWKILLTQLTRSSPDLVDTLFQRLVRDREPATAHRYFAFLTPVLRLRLFLTINFDTLLEEALRIEGFQPTVYEVADGILLPHPKLVQEGLSVVKLHGGAYGLLVGDKLDSPLDEETRARFRSYLPEHLVLLVMGIGGWDQRVLDMVELAHQRNGEVLWLHFEPTQPTPLEERFCSREERSRPPGKRKLPDWLHTVHVQAPGAFLRELYSEFKRSHPSSSRQFQVCDLRPVLLDLNRGTAATTYREAGDRFVVFEDDRDDYGLGAALCLSRFVTEKATTHLPIWIDLETKFTVEDILVDIIQQLRRYDPGLPPEILAMERSISDDRKDDFRKVIRRLYAALARGRYILAFNGIRSFGRLPTRHHRDETLWIGMEEKQKALDAFLQALIAWIEPFESQDSVNPEERQTETLGLLDSILAFALDAPRGDSSVGSALLVRARQTPPQEDRKEAPLRATQLKLLQPDGWRQKPILIVLTAIRIRRHIVALYRLVPKYLRLQLKDELKRLGGDQEGLGTGEAKAGDHKDAIAACEKAIREVETSASIDRELDELVKENYLWRVEGGDFWMSRKLRNEVYQNIRDVGLGREDGLKKADRSKIIAPDQVRALAALTFVHQDLAEYYHRDVYVGSQDISSLLEEIYHRIAALRYLRKLEAAVDIPLTAELANWIGDLAQPAAGLVHQPEPTDLLEASWTGIGPIVVNGQLDPGELLRRRVQGLHALGEVLEEEREVLLSRVPSVTLQGWIERILIDVKEITRRTKIADSDRWQDSLHRGRGRLENLLEDITVEILADRMDVSKILKWRRWGLMRLIRQARQRGDLAAPPAGTGSLKLLWPRKNHAPSARPSFEELTALCRLRESETETWHIRGRVARALADAARAMTQASQQDFARSFQGALQALLESWLKESTGAHLESQTLLQPIPSQLLTLKMQALRLDADLELWGKSPWTTKGRGQVAMGKQEKAAGRVIRLSEEALQILRSILENDRTDRAYFYSLKGRSLYLRSQFDAAYREFDLARAGLPEATARERETLAIILLRQAECLLLHSDHALTQWVMDLIRESAEDSPDFHWRQYLSTEGRRKLQTEEEESIESLLRLSLANCAPDRLVIVEERLYLDPEGPQKLSDQLGAMRSRLAAASELLERIERLLESSRSKIEWWACLFQLRSQLAVERLLLLLSGDLSPVLTTGASGATLSATGRDAPLDSDQQKHFINRFQEHLRQGVRSVRQGLDIVGRMKQDVLLDRLLRTWSELMVCGAYATGMGQRVPPNDDNIREYEQTRRWEQWRYLNWLAGLTILLRSEDLRRWFLQRKWDIPRPGLAARASVLARVDLCLARGHANVNTENGIIPLEGGDALTRLRKALQS